MIEAPQRQARARKRVPDGANPSKVTKGRQRASSAVVIGADIIGPPERGNPMGLPRVTPAPRTGQRNAPMRYADTYTPEEIQRKAVSALVRVVDDPSAPAAAIAQASRTLLELNGLIGAKAKPPGDGARPVSEMTLAQIEEEIERLSHGGT